jgi:4-hydroxybenzoate polyprenyltransferase
MRLRTFFELVRVPNVFTAPADVLMGIAVSGARFRPAFGLLLLASACAYMGGMALNDYFDAALDARERPSRPIPSGRLSRRSAGAVGFLLLAGSVALAATVDTVALTIAAALAASILLYDGVLKATALGPPMMGACRFFNVLLGVGTGMLDAATVAPALLLFCYVLVLTLVSRFEVVGARARVPRLGAAGLATVTAAAVGWALAVGRAPALGLVSALLLVVWLAPTFRAAMEEASPARVIACIKVSVLGIILFDGIFAGAARGAGWLVGTLALFVPAWVLGRTFASA